MGQPALGSALNRVGQAQRLRRRHRRRRYEHAENAFFKSQTSVALAVGILMRGPALIRDCGSDSGAHRLPAVAPGPRGGNARVEPADGLAAAARARLAGPRTAQPGGAAGARRRPLRVLLRPVDADCADPGLAKSTKLNKHPTLDAHLFWNKNKKKKVFAYVRPRSRARGRATNRPGEGQGRAATVHRSLAAKNAFYTRELAHSTATHHEHPRATGRTSTFGQ